MKANYNRKINVKEKAVTFRAKSKEGTISAFCIMQNTLFDRVPDDRDVVYLDFEDETQVDKMINTLHELKKRAFGENISNIEVERNACDSES